MLDNLAGQIKEVGYVPNTNYVPHDVEKEQEECLLYYRSEKTSYKLEELDTYLAPTQ